MAKEIRSMMPGVVSQLLVKPGDNFQPGDIIAIMESMKMEMPIEAEVSGTVQSLAVAEGDAVEEDSVILTYV